MTVYSHDRSKAGQTDLLSEQSVHALCDLMTSLEGGEVLDHTCLAAKRERRGGFGELHVLCCGEGAPQAGCYKV